MAAHVKSLLALLDEAFDRRSWHGTNLKGSIRGMTATQAAWRPRPGRHNVWEIVGHAAYWKYAVEVDLDPPLDLLAHGGHGRSQQILAHAQEIGGVDLTPDGQAHNRHLLFARGRHARRRGVGAARENTATPDLAFDLGGDHFEEPRGLVAGRAS